MKNNYSKKYKYGFSDKTTNEIQLKKGLSQKVVEQISLIKEEPDWMRENRINAYKAFTKLKNPK
ncbi:MAG: hypothetical protein K2M43_01405 [Mycoplasmoidaceae bacterium]|nr:hypothetical protein [Mycoplasmoidaceae bacterium]